MTKILSKEVLLNLEDLTGKVKSTLIIDNVEDQNSVSVLWFCNSGIKKGRSIKINLEYKATLNDFLSVFKNSNVKSAIESAYTSFTTSSYYESDLQSLTQGSFSTSPISESQAINALKTLINSTTVSSSQASSNEMKIIYSWWKEIIDFNLDPENTFGKIAYLTYSDSYFSHFGYIELSNSDQEVSISLKKKIIIKFNQFIFDSEGTTGQYKGGIARVYPYPSMLRRGSMDNSESPIYTYDYEQISESELHIEEGQKYGYWWGIAGEMHREGPKIAESNYTINVEESDPIDWEPVAINTTRNTSGYELLQNVVYPINNGIRFLTNNRNSYKLGFITSTAADSYSHNLTNVLEVIQLSQGIIIVTLTGCSKNTTTDHDSYTLKFYYNDGFENYNNLTEIYSVTRDTTEDYTLSAYTCNRSLFYTSTKSEGDIYICFGLHHGSYSKQSAYLDIFRFDLTSLEVDPMYFGKEIYNNSYLSSGSYTYPKFFNVIDETVYIIRNNLEATYSTDYAMYELVNSAFVKISGTSSIEIPVINQFTWDETFTSFKSLDTTSTFQYELVDPFQCIDLKLIAPYYYGNNYTGFNSYNLAKNSDLFNSGEVNYNTTSFETSSSFSDYEGGEFVYKNKFRISNLNWGSYKDIAIYYDTNMGGRVWDYTPKLYISNDKNYLYAIYRNSSTDANNIVRIPISSLTSDISYILNPTPVTVTANFITSAPELEFNTSNFEIDWESNGGTRNKSGFSVELPEGSIAKVAPMGPTISSSNYLICNETKSEEITISSSAPVISVDYTRYSLIWSHLADLEVTPLTSSQGCPQRAYVNDNSIYIPCTQNIRYLYNNETLSVSQDSYSKSDIFGEAGIYDYAFSYPIISDSRAVDYKVYKISLDLDRTKTLIGEYSKTVPASTSLSIVTWTSSSIDYDNKIIYRVISAIFYSGSTCLRNITVTAINEDTGSVTANSYFDSDLQGINIEEEVYSRDNYGIEVRVLPYYSEEEHADKLYLAVPTRDFSKSCYKYLIYELDPTTLALVNNSPLTSYTDLVYHSINSSLSLRCVRNNHQSYWIKNNSQQNNYWSKISRFKIESSKFSISDTLKIKGNIITFVKISDNIFTAELSDSIYYLLRLNNEDLAKSELINITDFKMLFANKNYLYFGLPQFDAVNNKVYMLTYDNNNSDSTINGKARLWETSLIQYLNTFAPEPLPEYTVGQRIGNMATVVGETTNSNGESLVYAVLDQQFRPNTSYSWGVFGVDTGLVNYSSDYASDPNSATDNTDYILNNYDPNNYPAFRVARNAATIEIEGVTYQSQLPTAVELVEIYNHISSIESLDPTSTGSLSTRSYWSSQEYNSDRCLYLNFTDSNTVRLNFKDDMLYIIPIFEIPGRIVS